MAESRLREGELAPVFSLEDQDGKTFKLEAPLGSPTILYFFPAAGSPGCTKEAADFQDHISEFDAAGYQIIGISPDPVERLKEFQEAHELTFSLLSDPDLTVHKLYGAYGEKSIYGRIYKGVLRSTMLIGSDGRILEALYNVKATGHTQMLLRKIKR
jgi:peroxiredoxin Q/BCP